MQRQRLTFTDHAAREMAKASAIQLVTRDMVSETIFEGVRRAQRTSKRGSTIWQANRFFGERQLRVAFEDAPWGCTILTVLWEGDYD